MLDTTGAGQKPRSKTRYYVFAGEFVDVTRRGRGRICMQLYHPFASSSKSMSSRANNSCFPDFYLICIVSSQDLCYQHKYL